MRSLTGAVVLVGVIGCGGGAFEQDNPGGAELAGAPSRAGSIGAAGAVMPEAGGAAGVAASDEGGSSEGGSAPATPCDVTSWKATAFATSVYLSVPEEAARILDGDLATRWASGLPREPGQWLELELGAGVVLQQLDLRTPENADDVPTALHLLLDGEVVEATITQPSEGVLRLAFEPRSASSARLELTSSAPSWWSIAELNALCE